jgi:nucleoside-triphosphatase THEP1
MLAPHPWADRIKQDPRVEVVMVSRANHQQVAQELLAWLKS